MQMKIFDELLPNEKFAIVNKPWFVQVGDVAEFGEVVGGVVFFFEIYFKTKMYHWVTRSVEAVVVSHAFFAKNGGYDIFLSS